MEKATKVIEKENITTTGGKKLEIVSEVVKKETEVEFLSRILHIQKEGGFGTHLNEIIKARIKSL